MSRKRNEIPIADMCAVLSEIKARGTTLAAVARALGLSPGQIYQYHRRDPGETKGVRREHYEAAQRLLEKIK